MKSLIATFVLCAAHFCLGSGASAKEAFQGTFASGPHILRIHQIGSRVCGEWSYATQSSNREGLLAGLVSNGQLLLTQCADFEPSCKPNSDPNTAPMRFAQRQGKLQLLGGNGDGSNQVFYRITERAKWSNAQAAETATFLEQCKW